MLEKLKNIKEHITQGKNAFTFDPARFNDPLATQVEWTPVKSSSGSNFRSHKLVEVNPSRLEYFPTLQSQLFSFTFIGAGLAIPLFALMGGMNFGEEDTLKLVGFMVLFGVVFAGVGILTLRKNKIPIVLDKVTGRCWKGRKGPDQKPELMDSDLVPRLNEIHAIQLLSQYVRSDKKSYYLYELNIVMNDGKRHNIMKHGSKRFIRSDAEVISRFLDIPVWDAAG
jgi:hypothetical protein